MWSLNAPSDTVRQPKVLLAPFARIRTYAPHAVLTLAFGLSRLSCYLAGVRFDATTLPYYLQFVDPKLLKSSLGQSIFYLKEQPPAFNVFLVQPAAFRTPGLFISPAQCTTMPLSSFTSNNR